MANAKDPQEQRGWCSVKRAGRLARQVPAATPSTGMAWSCRDGTSGPRTGRQRSRSERAFWGLALDICLDEYSHETYVDSDSILQAIAGGGR